MPASVHRLIFALMLLTSGAAAQEHPVFNTKIEPPQAPVLLEMLQRGGLVILLRHAATPDYQEPSPIDFVRCDAQRDS